MKAPRPVAYGIDFGTSNSAISIAYDGDESYAEIVLLGRDSLELLPTLVYLDESRNRLAGEEAVKQYLITGAYNSRLFSSLKTFLSDCSLTGTEAPWGEFLTIADLVAVVLRRLKAEADRQCGQDVTRVVLGHPVLFVGAEGPQFAEHQRLALVRLEAAARSAGFKEIAFLDEPSAALQGEPLDHGIMAAVDFGGGTFDVAVMEMTEKGGEVLSIHGAPIGGERFDSLLFDATLSGPLGLEGRYKTYHGQMLPVPAGLKQMNSLAGILRSIGEPRTKTALDLMYACRGGDVFRTVEAIIFGGLGYSFFKSVEDAKIALSTEAKTKIDFKRPGIRVTEPVSQREFSSLIAPDLAQLDRAVTLALADAGVTSGDIDVVVRTGGSSQIPAFVDMLHRHFPESQLEQRDAFSTVALGLGLRALEEWG
jgi:hypothetical chaperone protein